MMMDTRLLNPTENEKHVILSSYHPWLCLLCVIIGSIFSYFIPLSGQFRIDQSDLVTSASSMDSKIYLLMCIVIAIPMLVDTLLDCAYTMKNQEERILWYSKVLTISSITVPNLILLIGCSGNLNMMGYQHSVYNVRITSCGCTMAYASQRALEYDMKDVSGFCLLISILMTIAYSCRSLSCKSDPMIYYFMDKTSMSVCILAYLIFGYSLHLSLSKVRSSRYRKIFDEAILMVKLSTAIFVSWSFSAIEIQFKGTDESDTPVNCIRSYVYVQIIYTVVSISIPGRIARFEVSNATRALTEKKDFIRYISHEIRTPLNTVFLGLEFVTSALKRISMRESRDSIEPIVETVHDVYSSCKVAISILNDLLTSDKIEGGKMTLDLEYVNCCNYFISLAKPFKINAREKSIAFYVDCSKVSSSFMCTAFINVDKAKMGQVIRNLISNALKFTASGGTVTVTITNMSLGDRCNENSNTTAKSRMWEHLHAVGLPESSTTLKDIMRLEVRDTGAGISLFNQSKLFGQYVQFNANKLQKGDGSGLGLWISKGITELHGGIIGAFSEGEGKGSVFYIELPVTYSDNLDLDTFSEEKIAFPSPRASKSGIFCDSRISTGCSSPDEGVTVNNSEVAGVGPGISSSDETAKVFKRSSCNVILEVEKGVPLIATPSHTSSTISRPNLEINVQDTVRDVRHSVTEDVVEEGVEGDDEDGEFEDMDDDSLDNRRKYQGGNPRRSLSLDTVKGTAFTIPRQLHASTFPISPLTQSPFVSEKEPLYELAELLKKSIRTSISESIVSTKKSSDILSCIYPFIANAIPFQQPLVSTISSNIMGSRYGSLSASSRYYTHKKINDSRSGKSSPNSTSRRTSPSNTPRPSGKRYMHVNSPKRIEPAITSSPDVRCKPGSAPPSNVLKTGDKEFRRGPDTFPLRSEKRVTGLRSRKARTPKAKHLYFAVLCPDDPLWNVGSRSSDDQDRYRVENDNLGGFEDTAYEFEMPSAHDEIGILLIPVHNSIAPTIPAVDLMVEQNDKVHTPEVEQRDGHGREDSVDQVQEPGAKMQKNGALHYLIVDDVMMNRRMVHRVLSSYHHIVSQATDGKDCLKVWEEITAAGGTVDVVLMDNSMPIMTGPEAATAMRERGYKGIIIGVTGHAQRADIEEFERCGADAVLAKPLSIEDLNFLVDRLIAENASIS